MIVSSDVRVGDRERAAAAERLSAHAAAGRLSVEELEARLEAANAAVHAHELVALEADLPGEAGAGARRPWAPRRPAASLLVAVLALAVAASVAVGHPVVLPFVAALLVWRAAAFRLLWRP